MSKRGQTAGVLVDRAVKRTAADESAAPPSPADGAVRPVGMVLHELRSPLTAIVGFADTLARGVARGTVPPDRLADRLGRIRDAALRMDALLEELAAAVHANTNAAPAQRSGARRTR